MRRTKQPTSLIGLVLLGTLLLTGCATSPPEVERNANGDQVPHTALNNVRLWQWEVDEVVDQNHIRIKFAVPPEPSCVRHDVDVIENPDAIVITLLKGNIENAREICEHETYIAFDVPYVNNTMLIETAFPIGNKEVIDGGRLAFKAANPDKNP